MPRLNDTHDMNGYENIEYSTHITCSSIPYDNVSCTVKYDGIDKIAVEIPYNIFDLLYFDSHQDDSSVYNYINNHNAVEIVHDNIQYNENIISSCIQHMKNQYNTIQLQGHITIGGVFRVFNKNVFYAILFVMNVQEPKCNIHTYSNRSYVGECESIISSILSFIK